MTNRRKKVDDHLRAFLGEPLEHAQNVATFDGVPADGAFTLVTIGFCDWKIRNVRQELIFAAWKRFDVGPLAMTLRVLLTLLIANRTSIEPGFVFELPLPLSRDTELNHLFVYPPTLFADEFGEVGDVFLWWLIPITVAESDFIEEHGPAPFEQMLEDRDPDLLDLRRPSLV